MELQKGKKRSSIGIIFIAIGAVLIIDRLNLIPANVSDWLISWQMLLVAIGIFLLIGKNTASGIVLICIGGFFLLPELANMPDWMRRIAWPLILIVVGIAILSRGRWCSGKKKQVTYSTPSGQFDDLVIFGGRESHIDTQDFKGGRATCIFGGIEYDMSQAKLSLQGAVVDCICIFGGVEIKVPQDWHVKNEVVTILGGFHDKRGENLQQAQTTDPAKTIVVRGTVLLGGIEIKFFNRN